jgi:FADH2 O2-dependent halogenase
VIDVIIIGAGPAGLTLGCYLAQEGIPCLIVEREHHPRPHVGESLMPSTVRIMREIGFHALVESAGFPHSGGVVYHPQIGFDIALAYREFPQDGIDQDYTYHVDRARFDMLLMKHAEELGCDILQGVSVDEVLFGDDGHAGGIRGSFAGEELFLEGKIIVDAAGRATRIGRQLGLRTDHPVLHQFALHTWCSGVDRGRHKTDDWTHVYFVPEVRGWAWQAPIDDEITSIGLVAARDAYHESNLDVQTFFHESLKGNRKLARATRHALPIDDLKGDVNYSYRLDRVCGDGWLAIGDAARFLDPVFSSGVSVAMHSARYAAERISVALESGDLSRDTFLPYEDTVFTGAAIWDDFTRLFYRLLPGFTHLLETKEHRPAMMRMIQGDIQPDSSKEILDQLRAIVRTVEEADSHPWKDELVDLPL